MRLFLFFVLAGSLWASGNGSPLLPPGHALQEDDGRSPSPPPKLPVAENPESWEVHNRSGVELQRAGHLPEAAAEFRKALELRPDYTEALYNLGTTLNRLGDHAGAARRTAGFMIYFSNLCIGTPPFARVLMVIRGWGYG